MLTTEAQDAEYIAKLKIEIETMKPIVAQQASSHVSFIAALLMHQPPRRIDQRQIDQHCCTDQSYVVPLIQASHPYVSAHVNSHACKLVHIYITLEPNSYLGPPTYDVRTL